MVHLNSTWSIWYHSSKNSNWDRDSYVFLFKTQIAEEFWGVFKILSNKHFESGIVFIMRDDIFPDWSSPENINGGFLSVKLGTKSNENYFKEVLKHWIERLISDALTNSIEQLPNGLSISPKSGHCILKVWFKEKFVSSDILVKELPLINTCKYTSFYQKRR
tara:strand:+ start:7997 stop:8482 length:486 start_codon:yes stop_codon:yes gene_type:complete